MSLYAFVVVSFFYGTILYEQVIPRQSKKTRSLEGENTKEENNRIPLRGAAKETFFPSLNPQFWLTLASVDCFFLFPFFSCFFMPPDFALAKQLDVPHI